MVVDIKTKAGRIEATKKLMALRASKTTTKMETVKVPVKVTRSMTKKVVKIKPIGKKELVEFLVNNPEVALKLETLHHDFSGKQACNKARSIRKALRRIGIYLSKLGHKGARHDG